MCLGPEMAHGKDGQLRIPGNLAQGWRAPEGRRDGRRRRRRQWLDNPGILVGTRGDDDRSDLGASAQESGERSRREGAVHAEKENWCG